MSSFREPGRIDPAYFTRLERVTQWAQVERGLLAHVDHELLRIEVIRDDIVRLKISRGGQFDETPTYAVCAEVPPAPPTFVVESDAAQVRLITAHLIIVLTCAPFRLDAYRTDGSVIFETETDRDGNPWTYATLNDAFLLHRRSQREDGFFGLGEKGGKLNRKGEDYTLWNTDVLSPSETAEFTRDRPATDPRADRTSPYFDPFYVSIPFFYHLAANGMAAGLFVDNSYRGRYDFSVPTAYTVQFNGGQYTEYLFAGPAMRDILEGYTWLTGRMQPPPIWALGYHQCRWHRYDQAAIEHLAAEHRARHLPCDTLWLDIEYMDGYRVFTWNTELFPDVPGLISRLREQGFRMITIVDPGVKYDPGYAVFDQAVAHDLLCRTASGTLYVGQVWPGKTAFPDFALAETRAWWGELNAAHVQAGLAGIWNDMNEPATGEISSAAMRFERGQAAHERYHNQYALLMAMGTVEGLRQAMPELRTFVLSRAGFAGIQRYAANWMGDNFARWDHLWVSMPMALGFGLSGQPFVGADIGGFCGDTEPELFVRWMQMGVLTPFCRNHSIIHQIDQYAWSFGPVVEQLVRSALQLRYRLMPYLYASFMQASATGEPVQQPLVFAFQQDRTLRDIDDQFLLGRHILVAPVITPGSTARHVYLPTGTWYDWHTGEAHIGERFVVAATPLDRIPIYVRGGAVIPLWPEAPQTTAGYHPRVIELHIFVPRESGTYESLLHEDDGLTFGVAQGACYRTSLRLIREGNWLTLHAQVSGNGYAEFARQQFVLIMHGGTPATVLVGGRQIAAEAGRFVIANSGSDFVLEIDLSES